MALYLCEWDQFLVEDEAFREILKGLGKTVGGRMVQGVPHGFDRRPTSRRGNVKKDEMYEDAIKEDGEDARNVKCENLALNLRFLILDILTNCSDARKLNSSSQSTTAQ